MTRPKKARINELNICKKLIQDEIKRVKGTDRGMLVYGLIRAVQILMDHKKVIRPETINAAARGAAEDAEQEQPE